MLPFGRALGDAPADGAAVIVAPVAGAGALPAVVAVPVALDVGAVLAPIGVVAVPPLGGQIVPLTRQQILDVLAWQGVGTRISLLWRYAQTLDDEATLWVLWAGDCVRVILNDLGATVSAEIQWDVGSPHMEEGGILIFPFPMIGGRYAEYSQILRVRRPAAIPNMAIFGRRPDGEPVAVRGARIEGP